MGLNQTLAQMRAGTRKFANLQGQTALLRHPDLDVNDAINRALGSLRRKLDEANPDQRWLGSSTVTTSQGLSLYPLSFPIGHLISVDLTANGVRSWLTAFEMSERPMLADPSRNATGVPYMYRLMGSNIELLPTPSAAYSVLLWYVPDAQQFATGGSDDASTYDTISRLDDYILAYAARILVTKDRQWDVVAECRNVCTELSTEIAALGRRRDLNSPARIVDESLSDRFGRTHGRRRWA